MQLHQLKPKHKRKKKKRVGRGGKRGTYSGRGVKGQKARAGRTSRPLIRELIKKYPKLRGYKQKTRESKIVTVNVGELQNKTKEGEIITPEVLVKKGIIGRIKGRIPEVKILGKGEIKKKLIIKGCKTSKGAEEKIKATGGEIKKEISEDPKTEKKKKNKEKSQKN